MNCTLEISEKTYQKIKGQLTDDEKIDISSLDDLVGKKMFFRTVTYHILGKVVKIIGNIIQLECASWIPDSGRFMQFIKNGEIDEVEPVGDWFILIHSCTDFGEWKHELPTEQK